MHSTRTLIVALSLVVAPAAFCEDATTTSMSEEQFKAMSGMSVLGNNEAPKALVIVPWKSSQIGDGIGVVESLSNRPMPVDRDVFARELHYYELRTGAVPGPSAANGGEVRVGSR